ncbi:MAG TPA: phosphate-starvation-inducible PsiE family protein [Candidatus Acidoferrales bacterium]|nr:phosphate-starvation-inducible PsiE family protein [Candidatus Acidoferrales bacterium]
MASDKPRERIARCFTAVEDIVYVGLGVLLAASATLLLVSAAVLFAQSLMAGTFGDKVVTLLDRLLFVLMIVEVLYTVQVSFREHTLIPEPFLIVGLIAVIRRVLILTAEFSSPAEINESAFRNAMFELGLLTLLILALVVSLFLLRRRAQPQADRH